MSISVQAEAADLQLSAYDYDLPEELIAQHPLPERDSSRMMLIAGTNPPQHRHIRDILDILHPEDCLVLNNTRVIPARLYGHLPEHQAKIEVLITREMEPDLWRCLCKPGRKVQVGASLIFGEGAMEARCEAIEEDGARILRFSYDGIWESLLAELGAMPLPPYIHEKLADPERYQTVYAEKNGSVAAPTAGLHFTEDLLQKIRAKGTGIAEITLHVGIGTFRPVHEEHIQDHDMHSEVYDVDSRTAALINERKAAGGRIICVGTTSCRTVESLADPATGKMRCGHGETKLYIYPGFVFHIMDGLLTNFHLPESSLMMLVSAFIGRQRLLACYAEAVRERYRFYSFGDCMLLLPGGTDAR